MTNNSGWLDYSGAEILWKKICRRYDKKIDSVANHDESIKVKDGREISVKISAAEKNKLSLNKEKGKEGLYVPPQSKLIFGSDKKYVYDGTEDITVPVYKGEII